MVEAFAIRELEVADIAQVIDLWEAVGDYHEHLDTPQALARKASSEEGLFLVAEVGGRVVGTVMGSYDGRMAFIARLAVAVGHRRHGIATSLMRELERRLQEKGAPQASLLVWHSNVAGIALYESMGYELVEGVRYMRRRLPQSSS